MRWLLSSVFCVCVAFSSCAPGLSEPGTDDGGPTDSPLGEEPGGLSDGGLFPGTGPGVGEGGGRGGAGDAGGTSLPDAGTAWPATDGGTTIPPRCEKEPCTCVRVPPATACWHPLGGLYAPAACSGTSQCCGGKMVSQSQGCGVCACSETSGQKGCVPATVGQEVCFPAFVGTQEPLPASVRTRMTGLSWKPGCPIGLDGLSYLRISHWGFDGQIHLGEMVVLQSAAPKVLAAFKHLYEMRFPVERMKLVDDYGANDDASMAANNTSAFNCRLKTGGSGYSLHSYGVAIDLNPLQNPYVKDATVLPPGGAAFVDRNDVRQGMVVAPGPATGVFGVQGFTWGGTWTGLKDYQHFELPQPSPQP